MSDDGLLFVYVGFNGFPEGFAPGERQRLISRALTEAGNRVIILSRKGSHLKNNINLPFRGIIQGIEYIYTSGSAYRKNSFLIRNISKLIGVAGEFYFLMRLGLFHRIHFVIFYSRDIKYLRYYSLLSKILRFKIIIDFTELASSWEAENTQYKKFEKLSPHYAHGAFCISSALLGSVKNLRRTLPLLKLPAICDLHKIENIIAPPRDSPYLLFCGTLFYMEIIEFILLSFEKANTKNTNLYLVVNGGEAEKTHLESLLLGNTKRKNISVYSQLEYDYLIGLYKNALALLIPLRNTLQDIYRFPHKIGEYTASGRPLITTNVGEVKEYFTDMENALIASDYTTEKFIEKIEYVIDNPQSITSIGLKGKQVAAENFDYRAIGPKILQFLDLVRNNGDLRFGI